MNDTSRWLSGLCAGLIFLLLPVNNQAQQASLLQQVLLFLGVDSSPVEMKGAGDEPRAGSLWIADLATGSTRPVAEGQYRSPIFLPDGGILALQGETVVRFPLDSTIPATLLTDKNIDKLVGVNTREPDQVLTVLKGHDGRPLPAVLSLHDGVLSQLPMDWKSQDDVRALAHLQEWERSYGNLKLVVQRVRKSSLGGTREWQDVFLLRQEESPQNISHCDGVDCGQPSLSPDHHHVVFIKSQDR
jgi:hypothetical protein